MLYRIPSRNYISKVPGMYIVASPHNKHAHRSAWSEKDGVAPVRIAGDILEK